MILVFILFSFI